MRVSRFVAFTSMLAIAMTIVLWRLFPASGDGTLATVVTLGVLAIAADSITFLLPRGALGSIAFIPHLTAVLLVPNVSALLTIFGSRMVVEVVRRNSVSKIAFNVAQLTLAHATAICVYNWLGGQSMLGLSGMSVAKVTMLVAPPMVAAYGIAFVVNTVLVSRVIALSTSARTWQVWKENNAATIGVDILAIPLVFAFAWVYASYGPMLASLIWLPILGLRQLSTTNLELAQTNRELLELMIKSIEARDPYTSGHSRRVKEYAVHIARLVGLSASEVEKIGTAALLHDVGKIYDKYAPILLKQDRLTPQEWAIIKEHPNDGANLIATMTRLRELVPAVRHHHENWDGTGYPEGLKGEDIPLASRVIMFADTFDAMTTKRPYRGPMGEEEVRSELVRCRGRQFDPEITDRILASNFWITLFPPANRVSRTPRFMRLISSDKR